MNFYAIFYFTIPGESLQEIDTTLRLENEVLRHLVVALPDDYEPVTMKVKAEEYVKEMAEKEVTEAKDAAKKNMRRRKPEEKEAEVVKKVEKEEVVEPAPKAKKRPAEEVDEKLANVLDNPDLNF